MTVLNSDQRTKLSTPSYKLKKEKRESKKSENIDTPAKTSMDTDISSLTDPALGSVVGVVDGQGTSQSPGLSGLNEKKK